MIKIENTVIDSCGICREKAGVLNIKISGNGLHWNVISLCKQCRKDLMAMLEINDK